MNRGEGRRLLQPLHHGRWNGKQSLINYGVMVYQFMGIPFLSKPLLSGKKQSVQLSNLLKVYH